jgi:4-amino-4-deoxy-L-arabinose transferase-like glycosyltransferase
MSGRATLVAVLALALVWFAGLDQRKLFKPDEGRYGEIAREMVVSGDWTTPRLNGFKYFEKPALQYWMTAAAYVGFGTHEWTTRLWSALTGFFGILVTAYAACRAFGPLAGVYAGAVLASSLLYVAVGHMATLDMGVAFFLALSIFAVMLAQRGGAGARAQRGWMLVGWAAMAFAVLSKGLIGVVLPVGAVALYLLWQRDWALLRRLHLVSGAALFLAITVPWFVAVSMANPEFARFFFVHEHFERFLTKVHQRYAPPWFFIPVLIVGMAPWIPSLGTALVAAVRAPEAAGFRPARFLFVWCVLVFAFFSVSSSKLPPYILPMLPALAVLVGRALASASPRLLTVQAGLAALGGLALVPLALFLRYPKLAGPMLDGFRVWLIAAGVLVLALGFASAVLAHRGLRTQAVLALAAAGLGAGQLVLVGMDALSPAYSAYHVVERARPALRADVPFFAVDVYDHTLPFYLGRTVTMVAYPDELEASIAWEPEKFVTDIPAFVERWRHAPQAFALFRPKEFARVRDTHDLAARVIASDARFVIVAKP